MDGILGIVGAITGVAGLVIAIFLTRWQDKVHKKEIAEERAYLEARLEEEREYSKKKLAEEQAYSEKKLAEEQAYSEKKLAEEQAYSEKKLAEEQAYSEKKLAEERSYSERLARLAFLTDRIFDLSIPRELRLPFYEEYISMKGNGTAVRFWLSEENREKTAAAK